MSGAPGDGVGIVKRSIRVIVSPDEPNGSRLVSVYADGFALKGSPMRLYPGDGFDAGYVLRLNVVPVTNYDLDYDRPEPPLDARERNRRA